MIDLSQAKRLKVAGFPQDTSIMVIDNVDNCDYIKLTWKRETLTKTYADMEHIIAMPDEKEMMDWLGETGAFAVIRSHDGWTFNCGYRTDNFFSHKDLTEGLVSIVEQVLKGKNIEKV